MTIATALKAMGYATGQFGKNHLGDRNEFLPTVHGFDEFFGYLYHLDAMEDPCHPNYPQDLLDAGRPAQHGPLAGRPTRTTRPSIRAGARSASRRSRTRATLCPKRMETVDDEIRDLALKFLDKAKADGKPFFLWLNPTRMHIVTHLSPKYQAMRNSKNGWSIHEAGMAQLDDDIGIVMKKLKDMGVDDNTIVVFTTDNGTEVFTWPDGGQTPFAQSKGTVMEGGFRAPAMIRWPGKVPAGKVENGIISGLDWFPTFVAAAGNPNIVEELKKGKQLGDRTYKVHLDGYDQMDMITGKGPSNRHEIFYFGESTLGAVRIDDYKYRFIDQPGGWLGDKTHVDVPYLTNLRLDPFERTGWPENGTKDGAQQYFDWFKYEFWRFVFVQQQVAKLAMTAIEFPPMQKGRELQPRCREGEDRGGPEGPAVGGPDGQRPVNRDGPNGETHDRRWRSADAADDRAGGPRGPPADVRRQPPRRREPMQRRTFAGLRCSCWSLPRMCPVGLRADRPASVVERRAGEEGDRRLRPGHDDAGQPEVRAPEARIAMFDHDGTHVGRAADLHAGAVLPGAGARGGQGQARS